MPIGNPNDVVFDENFEEIDPAKLQQVADSEADEDDNNELDADDGRDGESSSIAGDADGIGDDLSATDAEREAIRERRREERKLKKQRQHDREDSLRRELEANKAVINQLNERLAHIDRRNSGFDLAQLDGQMNQLNAAYAVERERIAKGTAEGNGDEVAMATERMMQIRDRFNQLQSIRTAYVQNQNKPQPLDPRVQQYGDQWRARNKWYNPAGNDVNSKIAHVIDNALVNEGWDPTTPQYWDELDARVNTQIFGKRGSQQRQQGADQKQDGQQRSQQRSQQRRSGPPVMGSGSGSGHPAGAYVLSADRVTALKDAGLWDDPVKRKAAIENYKRYDKENGAA